MMKNHNICVTILYYMLILIFTVAICACVLPYSVPVPPSNITIDFFYTSDATPHHAFHIEWENKSSRAAGFEIDRMRGVSETTWTAITTTAENVTSYDDTTVEAATQYFYRIKAIGKTKKDSAWAPTFTGITQAEIQATSDPTVSTSISKLVIFNNPSLNHSYQVSAMTSSNVPNEGSFWSYDGLTFVDIGGDPLPENAISLSGAYFPGKPYGQFCIQVNQAYDNTLWYSFLGYSEPILAVNTSTWYGAMADTNWNDNAGVCTVIITDQTAPSF
jgi:hypothetical protein